MSISEPIQGINKNQTIAETGKGYTGLFIQRGASLSLAQSIAAVLYRRTTYVAAVYVIRCPYAPYQGHHEAMSTDQSDYIRLQVYLRLMIYHQSDSVTPTPTSITPEYRPIYLNIAQSLIISLISLISLIYIISLISPLSLTSILEPPTSLPSNKSK